MRLTLITILLIVTLGDVSAASAQFVKGTYGWHQIPFSELSGSGNTSPCPANNYGGYGYSFASNCYTIYIVWSSAAADSKRDRLIIWGGGHVDYSGNEIYGVELDRIPTCTATTPCIVRYNNPSPPNASGSADTGSDGLPVSRHTYQGEIYIPSTDQFLNTGGSPAPGGNGVITTWTFSMANLQDSCAVSLGNSGCNPGWTYQGTETDGSYCGENCTVTWDPVNFNVDLIDNQYNFEVFTPPSGPWTNKYTDLFIPGQNGNSVYDDHDQIVYYMGCYSSCSSFYISTLTGSSYTQTNVTLSGCGSYPVGYPYMVWDPIARAVRLIPNGSNTIYLLHPNLTSTTWSCTTETYGSTQGTDYPPPVSTADGGLQGMNGKFNYFPELDVFIYCMDPSLNCWYLVPRR